MNDLTPEQRKAFEQKLATVAAEGGYVVFVDRKDGEGPVFINAEEADRYRGINYWRELKSAEPAARGNICTDDSGDGSTVYDDRPRPGAIGTEPSYDALEAAAKDERAAALKVLRHGAVQWRESPPAMRTIIECQDVRGGLWQPSEHRSMEEILDLYPGAEWVGTDTPITEQKPEGT